MELDINTDWVQYSTYRAGPDAPVTGANGTSLLDLDGGRTLEVLPVVVDPGLLHHVGPAAPDPHLLAPRP